MSMILTYQDQIIAGVNVSAMYCKVQDRLQWRVELLFASRYEDLSREYLMPLALYLEDDLVVLSSPIDMMNLAAKLHGVLRARAVHHCKVTVEAIDMPQAGRFRVWATWRENSRLTGQSRPSEVIYYMRQTDQGMQSEMVHVVKLGSTELRDYCQRDCKIA